MIVGVHRVYRPPRVVSARESGFWDRVGRALADLPLWDARRRLAVALRVARDEFGADGPPPEVSVHVREGAVERLVPPEGT